MGLPILLGAALGLLGAIGVAAYVLNFKSVTGKKLAILGAQGTGKTTLATFLTSGEIPEDYEQTTRSKKIKSSVKMADLKIEIQDIEDLPGSKEAYRDWKRVFMESDIVIYIIDAHKVTESNDRKYIARIENDAAHIRDWILEAKQSGHEKKIFLLNTHCDLLSSYAGIKPSNRGDFYDTLRKNPNINKVSSFLNAANTLSVYSGSLKSVNDCRDLTIDMFSEES